MERLSQSATATYLITDKLLINNKYISKKIKVGCVYHYPHNNISSYTHENDSFLPCSIAERWCSMGSDDVVDFVMQVFLYIVISNYVQKHEHSCVGDGLHARF